MRGWGEGVGLGCTPSSERLASLSPCAGPEGVTRERWYRGWGEGAG